MFNERSHLLLMNMSYQKDWDAGLVNRNYHIRSQMLTSEQFTKILSVDFLPFTFKKKIKVLLREKPWKRTSLTIEKGIFWQLSKDPTDPRLFHYTGVSHARVPHALEVLHMSDQKQLCVWAWSPFASTMLQQFPDAVKVFDAVDNWAEHSSYANQKDRIREQYEIIRKQADTIFTVSQSLRDVFHDREGVVYVPNGVDTAHFSEASCAYRDLPQLKGPIVGYHGNIQGRVNFAILEYVAKKHPEYQFVLAGFVWKEVQQEIAKLKKYTNVHVYDHVSYQDLPSIISCFDVAIIPHKVDPFTQSMNPLKLYEYIAAGKPVISTAISGAEQFGDLVSLAVSPEDFSRLIHEQLQHDSVELMERRMQAIEAHTWPARYETMVVAIDDQLAATHN